MLSVTGSYTQDWLLYASDYNWRVEPDGGTNLRAVADIGTHWMDLAQFILGAPIRAVMADLATFHPFRQRSAERSTETFSGPAASASVSAVPVTTADYAAVLLRIGDGIRGAFHVSQLTAGRKNRITLEIAGTEEHFRGTATPPTGSGSGVEMRRISSLERDPALCHARGRNQRLSRWTCRRVLDTFKQLFRAFAVGSAGGVKTPPSPRSTTAIARCDSAKLSRECR